MEVTHARTDQHKGRCIEAPGDLFPHASPLVVSVIPAKAGTQCTALPGRITLQRLSVLGSGLRRGGARILKRSVEKLGYSGQEKW